ncbi:hypothetical protein ACTHGU_03945 [Chitinophagaceae bacterium MMS25-I14]
MAIFLWLAAINADGQGTIRDVHFNFYGDTISLQFDPSILIPFHDSLSEEAVTSFYNTINAGKYKPVTDALLAYKEQYHLNDWLYYQLIRKTAQQVSPKMENYERYTLYKWFLLSKSGYDATLAIGKKNELFFYVWSDENIYDIPYYKRNNRQYVCLNYHDYPNADYKNDDPHIVETGNTGITTSFSYKVTQMPDFNPSDYQEKNIEFSYHNKAYHFKVLVNPQVQAIFANYPVVDYASYFNIPLSKETYSSLIPMLRNTLAGMSQRKGVDYLMRFTRNAFLYENDLDNFGKEKRMSPEQTLLYQYSDCDDRAALFFYLVKEIYNLPMIALLYPTHITIAVRFDKPSGKTIEYNGVKYSVCEPTPQAEDLRIGQVSPELRRENYQVAYVYNP